MDHKMYENRFYEVEFKNRQTCIIQDNRVVQASINLYNLTILRPVELSRDKVIL